MMESEKVLVLLVQGFDMQCVDIFVSPYFLHSYVHKVFFLQILNVENIFA